ncbi:oligomeric Golgi complex subunit 7 [Baffinella frigidus]|nr:oligomeric Golgi complex subunit 7 [Cryptophyta sp. CCMP2293]
MDLEEFGEEDFDVKQWVNAQVRSSTALAKAAGGARGAAADDHLSTLVVKLQLLSQSAGKSIDSSSTKLLAELPQAMSDIQRVGSEAALLAQQMAQVLDRVSEVERAGQQTVAALSTLDAIKTRMEECAVTLTEAESVAKTLALIEPLFQQDELRSIAARLGSLRRSLQSMGHMEEFKDAAERLSAFEDRLEKRVSSKLKEGIENLDVQATRECLDIYDQMERRHVLMTRYVQARKPALLRVYSAAAEPPEGEEAKTGPEEVVEWLDRLHEALRQGLIKELQWGEEVFPDAGLFAAALWTDLMKTIAEPLQTRLAAALFPPNYGEPHLKAASEVVAAVARLSLSAAHLLSSDNLAGQHPPVSAVLGDTMAVLGKAQREYAEREEKVLVRSANAFTAQARSAASRGEVLRIMEEASHAGLAGLQQAAERALAFTCGAEGVGIARMLDQSFAAFVEALQAGVVRLRQLAKIDPLPPPAPGPKGAAHAGKGRESQGGEAARSREEGGDLVDETEAMMGAEGEEDWTWLQGAVSVLALVEGLSPKLQTFHATLRTLLRRYGEAVAGEATLARALDFPVATYLQSDAARFAALENLLSKAERRDFIALVRAPSLLQALKSKAEEFLVDAALSLVKKQLEEFPKLRVWAEHKKGSAYAPSFSSSPLPYVTAIAEHLFSLPEQLDPSGAQEDAGGDDGEKFMQHWVSRIGGALVVLYSDRILALPALSPSGRVQLATDVQYLASILGTLGAQGLQRLQDLHTLVEASDEQFAGACLAVTLHRADIDNISRKRAAGGTGPA